MANTIQQAAPRARVGLLLAGCAAIVLATMLLACAAILARSWSAFVATLGGGFMAVWPVWQRLCDRLFAGPEE